MTPMLHCKSRRQAEYVLDRIRGRFQGLQSRTSSGQDTGSCIARTSIRTEANPDIQFTFLGYTFRPRKGGGQVRPRLRELLTGAVSRDALKAMRQTIRGWRVQLKNDKSVADLPGHAGPDPEGMAAILRPISTARRFKNRSGGA